MTALKNISVCLKNIIYVSVVYYNLTYTLILVRIDLMSSNQNFSLNLRKLWVQLTVKIYKFTRKKSYFTVQDRNVTRVYSLYIKMLT